MFKAAGYRIGPSEIENCLVKHPAVANAAVVPSPDETRGNVVKAFIVLAAGHAPSTRARGRHPAARAQASRAVRVSEGDRVHRRAADDDDRQGAAQGAARARGARKAARRRRPRLENGVSAALRGCRRSLAHRARNAPCIATHSTAGATAGRISEPNWNANAIASRCHAEKPGLRRDGGSRGDRDVLQEIGERAPRDERQQHDVAERELALPARARAPRSSAPRTAAGRTSTAAG